MFIKDYALIVNCFLDHGLTVGYPLAPEKNDYADIPSTQKETTG